MSPNLTSLSFLEAIVDTDAGMCISGINRLTHNFELALPIVDEAFRYVVVLGSPRAQCSERVYDSG